MKAARAAKVVINFCRSKSDTNYVQIVNAQLNECAANIFPALSCM